MPRIEEDSVTQSLLKEWKPHKKQKEFIQLPFDIFEALYGGAAGSGKSDVCLLLPLIYKFHLHPKFKGFVLRRTLPDLEQEIIPRSRHWYGPAGAVYKGQNEDDENTFFSKATPSGRLEMFVDNEAAIKQFELGKFYYLDFHEVN